MGTEASASRRCQGINNRTEAGGRERKNCVSEYRNIIELSDAGDFPEIVLTI